MKYLFIFLILLLLSAVSLSAFAQDERWPAQASTVNPVGVKYAYGSTTGQEIVSKSLAAWSGTAKAELLKELGR